ncbi:guanine nucleotide binding protein, alpha subunit [Zopfochytrium polystomum]|nr:guanine nucleotide binding protein, alpha subunit [Zopfochytrium polystomum]
MGNCLSSSSSGELGDSQLPLDRLDRGSSSSSSSSSISRGDLAAARRSKAIDQQIKADANKNKDTLKLLLLGSGESGKSTILKQIKLIHGVGFSQEERLMFIPAILANIISSSAALVNAMDALRIPYGFDPAIHTAMVPPDDTTSPPRSSTSSHPKVSLEGVVRHRQDRPARAARAAYDALIASTSSSAAYSSNGPPSAGSTTPLVLKFNSSSPSPSPIPPSPTVADGFFGSGAGPVIPQDVLSSSISGHGMIVPPAITPSSRAAAEASLLIKSSPSSFGEKEYISPAVVDAIKTIWADPGIRYCYSRSNEFQLIDSAAYYFSDISRFCSPTFVPNDQDILSARVMTTTITENQFVVDGATFRIFDVGGQRSERKKWAPYFDDVAAIIFVAAISAYDQTCYEDNSTNRVIESLNLFESICNHPLFRNTSMVLFLNKIDLFKKKLAVARVRDYFPSYLGKNLYEPASEYFASRFIALNKNIERKIYVHFTWATDTKQIRVVLVTVNTIILRSNLDDAGL